VINAAGAVAPARRGVRGRGRLAGALAAATAIVVAVVAALLLAGHDPTPAPAHAAAFNGLLAGVPMQRARCHEWARAPTAQKSAAVRALSATIGGASTGGGVGTTMGDRQVAALFDRICGTPNTDGFALYLIYARAAAFSRVGAGGV